MFDGGLRFNRDRFEGNGKMEGRALARYRVEPDTSAVALDDLLTDGESDSGAGVFLDAMQALEDAEDALRVVGLDPDAVIFDRENPFAAGLPAGHMDHGLPAFIELDGVPDQVLKNLGEQARIGHARRQRAGS